MLYVCVCVHVRYTVDRHRQIETVIIQRQTRFSLHIFSFIVLLFSLNPICFICDWYFLLVYEFVCDLYLFIQFVLSLCLPTMCLCVCVGISGFFLGSEGRCTSKDQLVLSGGYTVHTHTHTLPSVSRTHMHAHTSARNMPKMPLFHKALPSISPHMPLHQQENRINCFCVSVCLCVSLSKHI